MKKITQEELNKIIENHSHWLNEDCEGWEDMRAYLSNCDLRNAYLINCDLRSADLRNCDLSNCDLSNCDLSNADLSNADLSNCDLRNAHLRNCDLSNADLSNADLRNCDLSNCDLSNADLRNCDLSNCDLSNAKNIPFIPMTCPDSGSFVGWKKCDYNLIVKLEIPDEARRSSANGRKCRCDKAKVLEIQNIGGTKATVDVACSIYNSRFEYRVGETVEVEDFCEDRFKECAAGIHFFVNRQEAVDYEI